MGLFDDAKQLFDDIEQPAREFMEDQGGLEGLKDTTTDQTGQVTDAAAETDIIPGSDIDQVIKNALGLDE